MDKEYANYILKKTDDNKISFEFRCNHWISYMPGTMCTYIKQLRICNWKIYSLILCRLNNSESFLRLYILISSRNLPSSMLKPGSIPRVLFLDNQTINNKKKESAKATGESVYDTENQHQAVFIYYNYMKIQIYIWKWN